MATLSGNKIKDTYQSLIKLTDNGNLTTGAKQLTDGFGNNSPLYISTTQIGIGVTPEATYDLHVYSNAKVGGNLTVTGDLTVEGTTTTIDTQTLTVEDPLIEVASNNTSTDAVDIGWYGKYAPSGTTLYAGLFRDTGDSKFKLFRNLEEQPTTTVNTSGTGYTVATLVADLEGTLTGVIASTTTATTQSLADNSTKVATTAYVDSSIGNSTLAEVLANGDTTGGGNIVFGDSDVFLTDDTLMFGASNDLVIYHDGSNSFIREKGTGNLYIDGETSISLRKYTGAENMLVANTDGSVELYYDASKKLETSSTGVTVTGAVSATTFSGELDGTISSATTATTQSQNDNSTKVATTAYVDLAVDGVDTLAEILTNGNTTGGTDIAVSAGDDITFTDTSKAYFGAGNDLEIYHNGTSGYIYNNTGVLNIFNEAFDDIIFGDSLNDRLIMKSSGAVELYYAGTKTFETTSGGISVTGTGSFTGQVTIPTTPVASTDAASKGYVDSIVTAQDLDFAGGSGTGSVDLDSQTFTIAGTTNEIETSASGQTLTIGLPNNVTIGNDLTVTNDLYIPSYIYHTGNTTTFFGFSGNNTIIFRTAGSTRLEIASDGHIGINESDPDTILHISDGNTGDPSTNAPVIRLQNTSENCSNYFTDGDVVGGLEFYNDSIICTDIEYGGGVNAYFRAVHDGSNSPTPTSRLEFGTGTFGIASTQMIIDSSGNVGIGVSPYSFTQLHIYDTSDIYIAIQKGTANGYIINDGTNISLASDQGSTGKKLLVNRNAPDDSLIIDSSGNSTFAGNVIIDGFDNSKYLSLRASGCCQDPSGSGGVGLKTLDHSGANADGLALYGHDGVSIHTAQTERLRIDSSGNVSIGDGGAGARNSRLLLQNAGSQGAPQLMFVDSGDSGKQSEIRFDSGNLIFDYWGGTSRSERMRIDSSGNVGINETNPAAGLHVSANGILGSNSTNPLAFTGSGSSNAGIGSYNANTDMNIYSAGTGNIKFRTGATWNSSAQLTGTGTEIMRITSGGDLRFGGNFASADPIADRVDGLSIGEGAAGRMKIFTTGNDSLLLGRGGSGDVQEFYYNASGSAVSVGSISITGSSTAYNTSSDYRLKEDLQDFNGLDKILEINVYDFKWKESNERSYGVMAHELQEVLSDAVSGEKDAINEDGNIDPQGVDYSKIVPLLVKSIQELKADNDSLRARIETLENN